MTILELIEKLQKIIVEYDKDVKVIVHDQDGYLASLAKIDIISNGKSIILEA